MEAGKETGVDNKYQAIDINKYMFLQVQSSHGNVVAQAYAALKQQATQAHSLRLAALAARLRSTKKGHFEEIIALIDTISATLADEQEDDIKKRDQCKDEYQ